MKTDWTPQGNRYARVLAESERVRAERQASSRHLSDPSERVSIAMHDIEIEVTAKAWAERAEKCAVTRQARMRRYG